MLPLELLLLAQIYASNRLSAGALPQTHWGAYIAPTDPLAGLGWGPRRTGRSEGRKGGRGGEGGERTGRKGRASRNKGGSKGGRGSMPPTVVSVCNIFCAWLLAFRHTTQLTSKRFVNRIAEGVGTTPTSP